MAVTRYVRAKIKLHVQANEIRPEGSKKERNQSTFTLHGQTMYDMDPDEIMFYLYLGMMIITYGTLFGGDET